MTSSAVQRATPTTCPAGTAQPCSIPIRSLQASANAAVCGTRGRGRYPYSTDAAFKTSSARRSLGSRVRGP